MAFAWRPYRHRDPSMLLEAMAQGRGASPKLNETRLIARGCCERLTCIKLSAFHAGLSRWRQQLAATKAWILCWLSTEFISVEATSGNRRRCSHRVETDGERNGRTALVAVNHRPAGINPTVTFVPLLPGLLHTKTCQATNRNPI
jgi:hypothetical protein